jgi:hypothetical protein
MFNTPTAKNSAGRYLTYLKNRTYEGAERILIRDHETITFTTHEQLDTWHSEKQEKLAEDEKVSLN